MTTDRTRFCGACGAARDAASTNFCGSCGTPFGTSAGDAASAVAAPVAVAAVATVDRQRPLWLVVALTFVTFGLYLFYWMGCSWADLKRIRNDPSMSPVGHFFSMAVPVYSLFRVHAHFRVLGELLAGTGNAARTAPGLMVIAFMATSALSIASRVAGPAQSYLSLATYAVEAFVVYHGQSRLNAYYREMPGEPVPLRVRKLEWLFLALFGILFFFFLVGAASGA